MDKREAGVGIVRVVMLTRPHCQQCAMMKRILGDRVEYADASERPDLTALTSYTTLPLYLVFDGPQDSGGVCVGSFYGLMPLAEYERRVSLYESR